MTPREIIRYFNLISLQWVMVMMLSACTIASTPPPRLQQSFEHLPAITWLAAPPQLLYAPSLETDLRENIKGKGYDPVNILRFWLRDRVQTTTTPASQKTNMQVQFIVQRAEIIEKRSVQKSSFSSLLDRDLIQLGGVLQVKIVIKHASGQIDQNVIEVKSVFTHDGTISLNELDTGYFKVFQKLSDGFNEQTESYLTRKKIINATI
ncbi:MAG: hypothetical protein ACON41_05700 [Parvibaculales bacterium]